MAGRLVLFLIGIFSYYSCTSDFNGPFPHAEDKPVLYALISPDSIISIQLSWPRPPGSHTAFSPVEDARVNLWEGDISIGEAIHTGEGKYISQHPVKEGFNYSVEATIDGFKAVTARTFVPHRIEAKLTLKQEAPHFHLLLSHVSDSTSAVWVMMTEQNKEGLPLHQLVSLYSNTTLADDFNRVFDSSMPNGYLFDYEFFIRLPGTNLSFEQQHLDFAPYRPISNASGYVITAGSDYDHYFRSAWLKKSWDPEINLPFTYYPVFVHSNVKNGCGIFAGYVVERFPF